MDMIRRAIHNYWFLFFSFYYACYIFIKIVFSFFLNKVFPAFYSKNNLYIICENVPGISVCVTPAEFYFIRSVIAIIISALQAYYVTLTLLQLYVLSKLQLQGFQSCFHYNLLKLLVSYYFSLRGCKKWRKYQILQTMHSYKYVLTKAEKYLYLGRQ